METFKIPVSWKEYGIIEIDAETIEEAIEMFDKRNEDYSLPEGDYIDGSFVRQSVKNCREFNEVFDAINNKK